MILTHEHPALLGRLLDRLDHPDVSVLVHVDAKKDLAPFERVVAGRARVSLVPQARRVNVHYCGFSMIRATLTLLDQAEAAGADRFLLLSGVDYPVRPLPAILAELAQDREAIAVDRRCDPRGHGHFDKVGHGYFFGDNDLFDLRNGHPRLVRWMIRIAGKLPLRRYALPVYHGSAWWCLTREAVAEIRAFRTRRPRLLDWFRWTRVPEEVVFQTILKQSSRAGRIEMDATVSNEPRPPHRVSTHYACFDVPGSSSPALVDLSHLDRIIASGALFARKVSPTLSLPLLDEIDRRFHGIG